MIISRTPLRISFAGGGSDLRSYYQTGYGAVVSTAINKYVYVMVNDKFDDYIRVSYSKTELAHHVDEIEHNIIRESLKMVGGVERGIDIVYMVDVLPVQYGTGLGVSSSITVGTLKALYAYKRLQVSTETIARQACEIEMDILQTPAGKQDQYCAAYGGINYIQFNADESVVVEPLEISRQTKDQMENNLMLFYTGLHQDSGTILSEQRSKTAQNLDQIGQMVGMAQSLRDDLAADRLPCLGQTLHEGWLRKRKLASSITLPFIDEQYEIALNAGATGGKLLGSGGGGFLLFYCEPEKQASVRSALSELKEMSFQLEPEGAKLVYAPE